MDSIILQSFKKLIDLSEIIVNPLYTTIVSPLDINGSLYVTNISNIDTCTFNSIILNNIYSITSNSNITYSNTLNSSLVNSNNINSSLITSNNIIINNITCGSLTNTSLSCLNIYSNQITCGSIIGSSINTTNISGFITSNTINVSNITSNNISVDTLINTNLSTLTLNYNTCFTNYINSNNIISSIGHYDYVTTKSIFSNTLCIYNGNVKCQLMHFDSSNDAKLNGLVEGQLFRTGDIVSVVL